MSIKNNRIALRKIKAKFSSRVLTDANSLKNASYDNLRISYLPEAVIIIKTAEEVGDVLKIAYKYNIPIVARGAGSSTTGSAVPLQKGWVIDLKKLNKIKINLISKVASVGVGAVTSNLQKKAEDKGLFYPPDPSSKNYSTIGGNIACNAGGLRCLKYGVTRDYVFGLEGYLANGDFVKWSLPLKKDVSGLNLRDLWIGSEGLLGIITKAHLKLIPFPKKRWLSVMAFKNERIAINSIHKIFKNRMNPSLCEFLDQQTVICAEKYLDKPIFKNSPGSSLVIIF